MSTGNRKIKGPFAGVYFGMRSDVFRRTVVGKDSNDDGHILVVGGAGSGKSAGIVIPTLKYFWELPFLAVDIKGELGEKSGRTAHVFNPCNPQAAGYDPFYLVRKLENPSANIRQIARTLVPEPPEIKDPFWVRAAQNILTGYLLAGYKVEQPFIELLKNIQSDPPEVILKLASTDEQASMFVSQYVGLKSETLAGIMAELSNHIIPFIGDSDIEASLSKPNIITPELLEEGKNIFLQIPEHRINQWKSLITLIIQQFLTHFEQRKEANAFPILFMIDEFARFGKMDGILHGLATLRSKKVTICLVVQSLSQLDAIYGHDNRKIIADNCSYKAILRATDADTQEYFSKLVGTHQVEQVSIQRENKVLYYKDKGQSVSMADKRIIRPEEFAYLEHEIVLLTPNWFGKIEKYEWYRMEGMNPLK